VRIAAHRKLAGSLLAVLCVGVAGCSGGGPNGGAGDAAEDPATLAADAYVWGSPLVVTQRTLQTLGGLVGVNRLLNSATLASAGTGFIVAPNQDTLYSVAALDLRGEPAVLTVPDVTDRYWVFQFLDAWTNSFQYIGTRATGGKGGTFVITPPGWNGAVPAGAQTIASPTPEAFVLGRYLVRDTADIANVLAISRTLQPLHAVTGSAAPPPSPRFGAQPGTPQQVGTNGAAFFDELGDALSHNPPASADDKAELPRFASLGIGPGLHPAAKAMAAHDSAALAALQSGVAGGTTQIRDAVHSTASQVHGWTVHLDVGTYTNDWLLRAAVANDLWGANVAKEAVYPLSRTDGSGGAYTGTKNYVVHFNAGQLPPVGAQGFWSLTLYGPDMFFVSNSIGRNAIGDRTQGLTPNADGSLDLYVQNAAPQGSQGNWLPAPTGAFVLMLRFFLPQPSVLDGMYAYPAVVAR
jgi:hypothetical protein